LYIIERQAMARMRFDTIFGGQSSGVSNAAELDFALCAFGMGVFACVEFHDWRAQADSGFNLASVGFNEQANADIGIGKPGNDGCEMVVLACCV
jgi:hypothetical protein